MKDKSIVGKIKIIGPLGGALSVKNLRKSAFSMPRLGINKMISVSDTKSGNQSCYRIRVNIYVHFGFFVFYDSRASH